MSAKASDTIKDQWEKRVIDQCQSGFSIAAWCRLNNIAPNTFYYWRDKFLPDICMNRADFKELSELNNAISENRKSGVSLQYQEFCIFLDEQFETVTLSECLKTLKELPC